MTDTFFYLSQDVRPTQAAPEDDENAGLLRRVGGLFGLGKSNVKRKRGDGDSDDDDDDNAIATSSKKKPKTAAKGGTGKTPGSPQPLGVANRHSKRAVTFANVGALPRKKKVYWTSGETRALEVGVRTLMDTNQFELGNTYDKQTNTLNDKWRKIYEQHKDVFDVNGRTTMDLKDKWRNILKARGGGLVMGLVGLVKEALRVAAETSRRRAEPARPPRRQPIRALPGEELWPPVSGWRGRLPWAAVLEAVPREARLLLSL